MIFSSIRFEAGPAVLKWRLALHYGVEIVTLYKGYRTPFQVFAHVASSPLCDHPSTKSRQSFFIKNVFPFD